MKTTTTFAGSALTTILTLGAMTLATPGATIIEDTFSRTGSLSGSSADTGQVWSGSGWPTSGTEMIIPGSSSFSEIGGLVLLPNTSYVLSMDVSVTAGGSNLIGFGFTDTAQPNAALASRGFMLHRENPEVQLFGTGASSAQSIAVSSSFPKTMEITLMTGATLSYPKGDRRELIPPRRPEDFDAAVGVPGAGGSEALARFDWRKPPPPGT